MKPFLPLAPALSAFLLRASPLVEYSELDLGGGYDYQFVRATRNCVTKNLPSVLDTVPNENQSTRCGSAIDGA
jgi:hypothetical protein